MDQDRNSRGGNSGPQLPSYMNNKASQSRNVYSRDVASASGNAPRAYNRAPGQGANGGAARQNTENVYKASSKPSGSRQASSAPAQARRAAGGSSNGPTRKKKKVGNPQKLMRLALVVFGALIFVVGGILIFGGGDGSNSAAGLLPNKDDGGTFLNGISVMGIPVGGKTAEEAKLLVENEASQIMGAVSIVLQSDSGAWSLTASDLKLITNTDTVLQEAMAFGREGTMEEKSRAKELLKGDGKDFKVSFLPDRAAVLSKLNEISEEINVAAVEPYAIPALSESNVQSFTPVEGQDGRMLDAEATADIIVEAIDNGDYQATLTPSFSVLKPTMSLDYIMENTKKISTFYTVYARSSTDELVSNRCFNIDKAANIINCYTVQAGGSWSFNDVVGPRTKAGGWKEANGISGGKEYTRQYGGGICQVSTTLYGALLRGNIKIPEGGRTKHSIPSSYADYGLDATVDTSGIDLVFENDTGAPLYIFVYITKDPDRTSRNRITVSLYGKPLPEGRTYVPRSEMIEKEDRVNPKYVDDPAVPLGYELTAIAMRPRYTVQVYLDVFDNGQLVESKPLYQDVYRGNEAEIHVGTGNHANFTAVPDGAVLMEGHSPLATASTPTNDDDDEPEYNIPQA
ncbi:VanW family protein [Eubacteriales bacterium OttesenSCG-928-K08]|nr:VanW family protein [Eubacteriales bacterium OttesenSCG-928-K08]